MDRETLRKRSQQLRTNATKEERRLWYDYLREYPVQWKRQKVIGTYIVDFYCDKAKLAIELDGSQHYEDDNLEYDRSRTDYLNSVGVEVIRFTNTDISQRLRGVCDAIDLAVRARLKTLSQI